MSLWDALLLMCFGAAGHTFLKVSGQASDVVPGLGVGPTVALLLKSGVRFGQGEGGKHLTERSSILALSMGNGDFQAEGSCLGLTMGSVLALRLRLAGELKTSLLRRIQKSSRSRSENTMTWSLTPLLSEAV